MRNREWLGPRRSVRARRAADARQSIRRRRWRSEPLEPRLVLTGELAISEFVAHNVSGLRDENGDAVDWIEVANLTGSPVDLDGWALTNDADLQKWRFPADTIVAGGERLVVFASGKDRAAPGAPLHTNFVLDESGGDLRLIEPDGNTIAAEIVAYPPQTVDVSYGTLRPLADLPLVDRFSLVRAHVPTSDALETTWTGGNEPFDDSDDEQWLPGFGAVGFETPATGSGFTVTTVAATAPIGSLVEADAVLAGQKAEQSNVSNRATINFTDAPSGTYLSHFGGNLRFGGGGFVPGDNFVVRATGTIWVAVEQAGLWTFGVAADDGFRLRIDGLELMKSEFFSFGDVQAAIELSAGAHSLELVYFENTQVSELELYAAAGHHSEFNQSFRLVGDSTPGALATGGLTQRIGMDQSAAMQGVNPAVYLRYRFTIASPANFASLWLDVDYNDAFALYLNGALVATVNTPGELRFDSAAASAQAFAHTRVNLTPHLSQLRSGGNILAIEALSAGLADTNFLFAPSLTARARQSEQLVSFATPTPGAANGVVRPAVSELVAENATTLRDDDGQTSGWIEVHNPGLTDLDLAGWFLTDDPTDLDRWEFPDALLPPGGYLVVFASGKNRGGAGRPLHTNFQLDPDGEYLALVAPDGATIAWQSGPGGAKLPPQRIDVSYGIDGAALGLGIDLTAAPRGYFPSPTPGAANGASLSELVAEPRMSVEHGIFAAAFSVELSTTTPGATVRYTLDGSTPSPANGLDYADPIAISRTTTLRAVALKAGAVDSPAITQTYLFPADVLLQSPSGQAPPGFPAGSVNGQVFDYGMDPEIVNDPVWGPQLIDALQALPSLSLVTDAGNLFDPANGMYVNAEQKGSDWERPVSVELIDSAGDDGFQIDAGMRIRGQTSRFGLDPRHSLRLFFRDRYGDGELDYPLFGDEGVDRFGSLDLRVDQLYSWAYAMYDLVTLTRDVFSRDTQRDLGRPYARSRYYHLYLNGQYWGIYQSQEHIDAEFTASYLGGDADDYDVVKAENNSFVTVAADGDLNAWTRLWAAASAGFAADADYQRVQGRNPDGSLNPALENLIDVDDLIDYILITFYTGNYDGPITASQANLVSKNWYGARSRTRNEGFRFFIYDAETTLLDPYLNHLGSYQAGGLSEYFNPQWLHERLLSNANYRQQFVDRANQLLSPGGLLSAEANVARHNLRAAELSQAIVAESARWGDAQRAYAPFTKAYWEGAVAEVNQSFFPRRAELLRAELLPRGMDSPVNAPQLSEPGGLVPEGTAVTAAVLPGAATANTELVAFNSTWRFLANGVDQGTGWREPGFNDSTWSSANGQLGFGDGVNNVPFGPDPNNKYTTTYFRRTFSAANPAAFQNLLLQMILGEGAVVYLNGQELARSAMPSGPIGYGTFAALDSYAPFSPDAAGGSIREFLLPADLLVAGVNTLAVEIHQELRNSSELIFNLRLLGRATTPATTPLPAAIYFTTDGSDPRLPNGEPSPGAQRFDRTTTLVDWGSPATFIVPSGVGESGWQQPGFDDSTWQHGLASIGFDTGAIDAQPGFTVRVVDTSSGALWDLETAQSVLDGTATGVTVSSDTTTRLDVVQFDDDFSPVQIPGTVDREHYAMRIDANFVVPVGNWTLALSTGINWTANLTGVPIGQPVDAGTHLLVPLQAAAAPANGVFSFEGFAQAALDSFEILIAPGFPGGNTGQYLPLQNGVYGWQVSTTGAGNVSLTSAIGQDLAGQMLNLRGSAYLRVPFNVSDPEQVTGLALSLRYDDGFVAYVNDTEVARRNAPASPAFNSLATQRRADADALTTTWIDLTSFRNLLTAENNVLAIHGLNVAANNPDFLVTPKLQAVYGGNALEINQSTLVRSRALLNGQWSPITETQFTTAPAAAAGNLVVTEINYRPEPPTPEELAINPDWTADDFEFIELTLVGSGAIDLSAVRFDLGIGFSVPLGTLLREGEYLVIAKNPAAFQARYGAGVAALGPYTGQLANGGEQLRLVNRLGTLIQQFTYDDDRPWPTRADGLGATLEIVSPTGDFDDSDNWNSSDEYRGSPGRADTGPIRDVVINEVLTHSLPPQLDQIELHNVTAAPIDVGGWYLSDAAGNFQKYRLPAGTVIPPGGYLTLDETQFNPTPQTPGPNDFALDGAHGDDLWLMAADGQGRLTRFVDDLTLDPQAAGESWGRWPNGGGDLVPMLATTFGGANSEPRVGPVVISELMYNPSASATDDDLEYIELTNIAAAAVDLGGWKFDAGVDYTFPAGTLLPAGARVVLVHFDPSAPLDATKLAQFHARYGSGMTLLGGYAGVLDDGGETVRLVRPGTPPLDEPDFIPYSHVDEVQYDDQAPWPLGPDGTGLSLSRRDVNRLSREAADWSASAASPGGVGAAVVGRHVFYNNSSYDGNDPAAGSADDGAIAPDKAVLLPGQTATFANYTSYSRGINGLMIDVGGLPGSPTAADFAFRVGNNNEVASWTALAVAPSVSVRPGAGAGGSDRITLVWPDGTIVKQWLQVTVLANARTGLAADDVFYFGNAIGETGNSTSNAVVNAGDEIGTRVNSRNPLNPAPIDFRYDHNRDRLVNAADQILARVNSTNPLTALRLLAPPASSGAAVGVAAAAWQWNVPLIDEGPRAARGRRR